ncbi:MAG: hypothetical protein SH847_08300, partial [Roseiflexaceae bacterium]|nr:hypothetical protein [Roseiflexaceae bacterium]
TAPTLLDLIREPPLHCSTSFANRPYTARPHSRTAPTLLDLIREPPLHCSTSFVNRYYHHLRLSAALENI